MVILNKSAYTILSVLIALLLLVSCTQKQKEDAPDLTGYTKRTIKLINGVGTVSIYLPNEMDSAFNFIQHEDYTCGDEQEFRISSKKYTIDNDGGWFHRIKIDSIYEFTIEQRCCFGHDATASDSATLHYIEKNYIDMHPIPPKPKGILLKINSFNFGAVYASYKWYRDTSKSDCKISAFTKIKTESIGFTFACIKKDTAGFINQMLRSLKTIEIDTTK